MAAITQVGLGGPQEAYPGFTAKAEGASIASLGIGDLTTQVALWLRTLPSSGNSAIRTALITLYSAPETADITPLFARLTDR